MNKLFLGITVIILSYLTTYILVPFTNRLGKKFGFIDKPDFRKINNNKLSRLGGLAILSGFIAGLLILKNYYQPNSSVDIPIIVIIITSILVFAVGLVDDKDNISPWPRLGCQFLISSIAWTQGLRISSINLSFLTIDFFYIDFPIFLSFLITIVWITGLINAFNWLDGLDGLAIGIALIASIGFGLISFQCEDYESFFISLSIIGFCLAFLNFNFYPSKILMGDCGSYFIGYNLALLSLMSCSSENMIIEDKFSLGSFNLFLGLTFLFIPIIDMTYVIFSRLLEGESPFFPDKRHLHHKLLNLGFTHRNSVILIYIAATFFSIFGYQVFR